MHYESDRYVDTSIISLPKTNQEKYVNEKDKRLIQEAAHLSYELQGVFTYGAALWLYTSHHLLNYPTSGISKRKLNDWDIFCPKEQYVWNFCKYYRIPSECDHPMGEVYYKFDCEFQGCKYDFLWNNRPVEVICESSQIQSPRGSIHIKAPLQYGVDYQFLALVGKSTDFRLIGEM